MVGETVSRREDFDIVDDDEQEPRGMPAWWLWLGGATLLIILAGLFAVFTFTQRMAGPSTPPSPTPAAIAQPPATEQSAADPLATETTTPTPDLTPTAEPTPEETATPTTEPTATPCPVSLDPQFAARYDWEQLGCPVGSPQTIWSAWQPFQGGQMYWRRDTDQAFVLGNNGIYSTVGERWDGSAYGDRGAPPPGLYAPEQGFGAVWTRSDELFNLLGWATAQERGFCARIQDFEYGSMVTSDPTPSCTPENLYNHASAGDWPPLFFRFTEAGTWQ